MARYGKIARLPKAVRETVATEIEDGIPFSTIVERLNADPVVQGVLKEAFPGTVMTEQNVAEWKENGGYREDARRQEAVAVVQAVFERAASTGSVAGGVWELADALTAVLTVELARQVEVMLNGAMNDGDRWRLLGEALDRLAEIRRHDTRKLALREAVCANHGMRWDMPLPGDFLATWLKARKGAGS